MGLECKHVMEMGSDDRHHCSFELLSSRRRVSPGHRYSRSSSSPIKASEGDFGLCHVDFDGQKWEIGQKDWTEIRRRPEPNNEVQNSLRKEILELEDMLQDQVVVRCSLEKALGYRSNTINASDDNFMPKPAQELIQEIAVLEFEVMYLENYLLSLYQKAYGHQSSKVHVPKDDQLEHTPTSRKRTNTDVSRAKMQSSQSTKSNSRVVPSKPSSNVVSDGCSEKLRGPGKHRSRSALFQRAVNSALMSHDESNFTEKWIENPIGSGVHPSHSALSYRAVCSALVPPHSKDSDETFYSFHSQPLSFQKYEKNTDSQILSLAECLGTRISDHVPETPNRLSEDLLRCIGSIYCRLAEPPLEHLCVSSSLSSSLSSVSAFSPQFFADTWSPLCTDSSFDKRLENPFRIEGLREFSGPYSAMVEVDSICTDARDKCDVHELLNNFRQILNRLENIEIKYMKNEEKIAFWLNIHNAILMHAYVQHGAPKNCLRRSTLLKTNFKIGGHTLNADIIQNSILGHRTHRHGPWLKTLLSPRLKLKTGDDWAAFALEQTEPLLHFALCSGNHSDPAVRIYNPKRVLQQLETAKEEYIRASVGIHEQKILVPKILEFFAKDSNLTPLETVETIQLYLPETLQLAMRRFRIGKSEKCIEWLPLNSSFRYLMSRELLGPILK